MSEKVFGGVRQYCGYLAFSHIILAEQRPEEMAAAVIEAFATCHECTEEHPLVIIMEAH